jgi:hypothetical protein
MRSVMTGLAAVLLLAGCAASSVHELRTSGRFYKSYELNMSLGDIDAAFYNWASVCEPIAGLTRDPANPTKAMLVATIPDGILALMDFTESPPGHTSVKSYVSAGAFRRNIDETVAVIKGSAGPRQNPSMFPSSPSPTDRCRFRPLQRRSDGGETVIVPVIVH